MDNKYKKQMNDVNILLAKISERLDNVINSINNNHTENKEDHAGIIARQDHTNGNVSKLEKWKYLVCGGFIVAYTLLPILIYYRIEVSKYEITETTKNLITEQINKYIETE